MATNNSAVFTVLFRSVGHWKNVTRVGSRKKFREVSCTDCTGQGNDLELIPAVKMKTKHPVKGSMVVNFRRSVIIAELWRPDV